MAYATTNPPKLLVPRVGTNGIAIWGYNSTDAHATVEGAGYFTDGDALGLKVGDHMLVGKTGATEASTVHYVKTVTAGGAATIAAAVFT